MLITKLLIANLIEVGVLLLPGNSYAAWQEKSSNPAGLQERAQNKEAPKTDAEIAKLVKPGEVGMGINLKDDTYRKILKFGDRVNVAATVRDANNEDQTRYIVEDVEVLFVGPANDARPQDPATRLVIRTTTQQALIIKAYDTYKLSFYKLPASTPKNDKNAARIRILKETEALRNESEALLRSTDHVEQMKNAEAKLPVDGQRGSNDDKTGLAGKVEIRRAETAPAEGLIEDIDPKENRKIYLHKRVELDNKDVAFARYEFEPVLKQHAVAVTFTTEGAEKMGKLTKEMVGKRLAILLNGKVVSAPTISSELSKGALISGMKKEDAEKLVKAINGK